MENPEEVLQALDEFQKMRPSEIPRELEDYLCWVARTGDPVYQWSLVKALFREKLMRVMTEFYESCPTLDLTPCPNVEQFNYDIMKRNLIERLESFANAPFTVQRICELLTTPRKEYNRIDKFMRAIEKNILVVSTREPGPFGRRSENGDSLVNGSVEDETSHHGHTSNEVEMENWVKDCTAATAVSAHSGENEDMSVENGLNSSIKTSFEKEEKMEMQLPAVDATASSFVTSSSDFSGASSTTTQVPAQESSGVVQNLTTTNHEASTIVGDVSDVIMNEDTSSQPSLELESDDNDSSDSKKLQTTFQAKDFNVDEDNLSPKSYSESSKDAKSEDSTETPDSKDADQLIESSYSNEKLVNENTEDLQNSDSTDNLDAHSTTNESEQVDNKTLESEPESSEKSEAESNTCVDTATLVNNDVVRENSDPESDTADSSETLVETKCDNDVKDTDIKEEEKTDSIKENEQEQVVEPTQSSNEEQPSQEEETETETETEIKTKTNKIEIETISEVSKPIIEEPLSETTEPSEITKTESSNLTIEESTEEEKEDTKTNKSIVPDPIPIIEEPKESESEAKDWKSSVSVTEVLSEPKEDVSAIKNGLDETAVNPEIVDDSQMVITSCEEPQSTKGASELMDVDNEALASNVQQDEPMEQETSEPMNS